MLALVLSVMMLLSVCAVGMSVFAEDGTTAVVETTEEESEHQPHTTFFEITVAFWKEVFNFFKYIFYDVFLGLPVPDIKPIG